MRGIVWFRRDLRLHDQPALATACEECDEIIPLFVFDEPLLQSHEFGSACVNFMLGCVETLGSSLAGLGIPLQWRRGEPVEEVVRAVRKWKADIVYWNRDYEPRAKIRDQQVQRQLTQMGISVRTYKDHVVFEAEEVRGATGEPMQRYSAYRARWWTKWHAAKPTLRSIPHPLTIATKAVLLSASPLPTANELAYDQFVPWIEPGERSAREQLRCFIEGPIHQYAKGRNRPAIDGISKLSRHFRFGTLSPRVAVCAALEGLSHRSRVSRPDVLTWIDELIRREFFFSKSWRHFHTSSTDRFEMQRFLPRSNPGRSEIDYFRPGAVGEPVIRSWTLACDNSIKRAGCTPCSDDRGVILNQGSSNRLAERRTIFHAAPPRC